MKIGFDISILAYQGTGVATYTYNIVKHLLLFDKKNEYRLFYSSLRRPKNFTCLKEFERLGGRVYNFYFPAKLFDICWNKFHLLPVEWLIGKVDFFHSSDFLHPPLLKNTVGVTTVHDLIWEIYPSWHAPKTILKHQRKMTQIIKSGDVIIVPSESTKHDLLTFHPDIIKTNHVYVIHEAAEEKFKPINDRLLIKRVLNKYQLPYPKKYLLYVGAVEPRKNLETAIRIYSRLIKNQRYSNYDFLLIGKTGWNNQQTFQLIEDLGLSNKVKIIGFVKDEDIPYFYNSCIVNIYLSLYEGFGLPPIEAAACNKPTLMYRHSALAEIFPAKYPFTERGKELLDLIKLIESKNIKWTDYVKKYSWQRYCQKFLKILKSRSIL